jgi:hypothetical protein
MEKGTNTDPIDIKNQKDANPIEVGISSNMEVRKWKIQVSLPTNI